MFYMKYIIEGEGALVNETEEEQPLKAWDFALVNEAREEQPQKAGDFALVNPDEIHQYRNKGDKPFKMIYGVPKEFE